MNDIGIAQWTSHATPTDSYIGLGFIPVAALIVIDVNGDAAPEAYLWTNTDAIQGQTSKVTDVDQVINLFGAANALTGAVVEQHEGGDIIPATNETAATTSYFERGGQAQSNGENSKEGLLIKAALQNASADNLIIFLRGDQV